MILDFKLTFGQLSILGKKTSLCEPHKSSRSTAHNYNKTQRPLNDYTYKEITHKHI